MTDHAVIAGTFADCKLIKTRSALQLIIEVPIEQADQALTALGGVPQPGKEKPVAVARLNSHAIEPPAKKGTLAQQAGILCGDVRFLKFIAEKYPHIGSPENDFEAAASVRAICGVESRAQFDSDPAAGQRWRSMKGAFDAWLTL
jgi:hypothetical protein